MSNQITRISKVDVRIIRKMTPYYCKTKIPLTVQLILWPPSLFQEWVRILNTQHQTSQTTCLMHVTSGAVRQMPGDLCTTPGIISSSPLSLETDVTDVTHGARGLWLGTRTGAADIATLAWSFLAATYVSMNVKKKKKKKTSVNTCTLSVHRIHTWNKYFVNR